MDFECEKKSCDVLVIGSGGAGLRAAIAAHDDGAKVLVLGKTLRGKAHTVMAEGGVNAALGNLDPEDNWLVHAADTLKEGEFLSDPGMVEILAKEAPERVFELERWGAVFDRTPDGKIMQRPFGAHTYRRTCHVADRTGLEILQSMLGALAERNIDVLEEICITKIFTEKGQVTGAFGLDMKAGKFILFEAKAIVLATGGVGRIFKITSNPGEAYGNGFWLAFNAGASLMDMEMIQFHPTGMVFPEPVRGILVTEAVRGEGGVLKNAKGERLMEKYDPQRMELSARDVVARAIYHEIKAGRGTENGAVYLDISHKPKEMVEKKLGKMVKQFRDFAGVDITKEPMEVAPTAHYCMGGIATEPGTGATDVVGLFAAGECTGGLHGANRLGGNSLIDLLVFGRRAGLAAGEFAKKRKEVPSVNAKELERAHQWCMAPLQRKGEKPQKLQAALREAMWQYVSIERTEEGLQKALDFVEQAKKKTLAVSGSLHYNPEWHDYVNTVSMVFVAEAIIKSALHRKESRGAHYRSDFLKKDPKWLVNIYVHNRRGKLSLGIKKVPPLTEDLKRWFASKNISVC